jgi:RNA polymerase sigma-70 factor (ECF subfamily)
MPSDPRVAAAAGGDRRAAEALLSELLLRVRNLVRYIVRGDDIDDIVQEGLVAIVLGLPSYRGDGAFLSWCDRIVARIAVVSARRRRAEHAAAPTSVEDVDMASSVAAPDEFLARRRKVAALDALSDDMRQALVLHHVLEMSVPEIADELGVPAETVRSRLRLARGRMREKMASQPDAEGNLVEARGVE